jgi:hypothetical protein
MVPTVAAGSGSALNPRRVSMSLSQPSGVVIEQVPTMFHALSSDVGKRCSQQNLCRQCASQTPAEHGPAARIESG